MNVAGFTTEYLFHLRSHSRDYKETNKLLSEWTTSKPQVAWHATWLNKILLSFLYSSALICVSLKKSHQKTRCFLFHVQELKQLYHVKSKRCVEVAKDLNLAEGLKLMMLPCNYDNPRQQWLWDTRPLPGPSWRKDMAAGIPVLWGPCWRKDTTAVLAVVLPGERKWLLEYLYSEVLAG